MSWRVNLTQTWVSWRKCISTLDISLITMRIVCTKHNSILAAVPRVMFVYNVYQIFSWIDTTWLLRTLALWSRLDFTRILNHSVSAADHFYWWCRSLITQCPAGAAPLLTWHQWCDPGHWSPLITPTHIIFTRLATTSHHQLNILAPNNAKLLVLRSQVWCWVCRH